MEEYNIPQFYNPVVAWAKSNFEYFIYSIAHVSHIIYSAGLAFAHQILDI